jgi:hypothetical protein
MKAFLRTPGFQRGAALMLLITVLVLGIAWYTVGALGKSAPTTAAKEIRTGRALQAGKQALLDYIAKEAALPSSAIPGRMPCPEPLSPAAGSEGIAAGCSDNTATFVGRLPWRTLGVEQIRDGHGEPLWYILGRGYRQSPINFGSLDEIEVDGVDRQAVALIIAPGAAVNTLAEPAAPPAACPRVNQQPRPLAAPFDPVRFLECGRDAVPPPGFEPKYNRFNAGPWTNDRIIVVTAAEVLEAIAGPVADRLQRQVAPAMNDFRTTTSVASWGQSFLPDASDWNSLSNAPPSNNLCGNDNIRAGMPPTATVAAGTCNTNWASGSASGLLGLLNFGSCVPGASDMRCDFSALLPGLATPRITARAPRIARTFRSFDPASIQISRNGGPWQSANVQNYSGDVTGGAGGDANVQFDVVFPLLSIAETVVVRIPHPTDALLADPRAGWFLNNGWDRFTYYAVTRAATSDPGATVCNPGGTVTDCLTVTGMPAPANDKRLVLTLMGRTPIPPATWPSASPANYLEGENATPTDRVFEVRRITASFNDRLAACPFQYPTQGGGTFTLCN